MILSLAYFTDHNALRITVDGDCSHEIKRHLLLGREVMENLGSIFKSRDITSLTKVSYYVWMWELDHKKAECQRINAFELCGVEDSWESLGLQGDPTSPFWRRSVLNIHWKDWCWSCNTLVTWCEELIHWKRPWCWERLEAGGGVDDRGWDGWTASPSLWTWAWASSRSW